MEDNVQEIENTEVVPDREESPLSIREALAKQLENTKEQEAADETPVETESAPDESGMVAEPVEQVERVPLAPPADMNKAEKDAFLNPTAENAHILQSYLNRRAYETRADYSRRMQEVEALKQRNQSMYDAIQMYEEDYAKEGIGIQDAVRRSIAWDRAMKQKPVETALEWLQTYNLSVDDLINFYDNQTTVEQPNSNYLTREEAEAIAEERIQQMMQSQEKKAVEYFNQRVVESFISQKPLFRDPETAAQLEAEMAPVVEALNKTGRYSSPEQILETAYNYVVNGNPVFSGLNQRLTAKPMVEQQQAAVQKAKQAAKSITGSAGSGSPRIVTKDLRDNLRRRMASQ